MASVTGLKGQLLCSDWLASALRLDKCGSPPLTQLLSNGAAQKRRLLATSSTRERLEACVEVLEKSVSCAHAQSPLLTVSNC